MYLTARETAGLSGVLDALTSESPDIQVRRNVGKGLLDLLRADFLASYVWRPEHDQFDERVSINMDDRNLRAYEAHYQFRDPITYPLSRFRRATNVNEVMPQDDLVKTEFYGDFLARDGLFYGMNYFAYDGDTSLGDLRIWRHRGSGPFDERQRQVLELVGRSFTNTLKRTRLIGYPGRLDSSNPLTSLTARECDVALAVAKGLTDQEVGVQLGMSYATVRTHLMHVFAKLSVGNRTELGVLVANAAAHPRRISSFVDAPGT